MKKTAVQGQGAWRRLGRPVILCALVASLLLWLASGHVPYTSGQFADYETDTSDALWMSTHPADIKIVVSADAPGFIEFTSDIPGCPSSFSFTFAEAGSQSWLCNPVPAGTYEVTETTLGWDITISCIESDTENSDDDNPPSATIVLEEYEKVMCTFTNEIVDTGSLAVDLDYSDDSVIGLDVNVACDSGASPDTNGMTAYEGTPAEFQINDLPPGGTSCDAELDSPPADYAVDDSDCAGVSLTPVFPDAVCTIVLTKLGSITFLQDSPSGEESTDVTFEFSSNLSDCEPGQFLLAEDDGSETCSGLVEDTYTVTQIPGDLPSGWILSDIDCSAVDSENDLVAGTVTIDLQPGEDVTCVFVNEVPS